MNDKTYEYKRYMRNGSVQEKTAVVRSRSEKTQARAMVKQYREKYPKMADMAERLIAEEV